MSCPRSRTANDRGIDGPLAFPARDPDGVRAPVARLHGAESAAPAAAVPDAARHAGRPARLPAGRGPSLQGSDGQRRSGAALLPGAAPASSARPARRCWRNTGGKPSSWPARECRSCPIIAQVPATALSATRRRDRAARHTARRASARACRGTGVAASADPRLPSYAFLSFHASTTVKWFGRLVCCCTSKRWLPPALRLASASGLSAAMHSSLRGGGTSTWRGHDDGAACRCSAIVRPTLSDCARARRSGAAWIALNLSRNAVVPADLPCASNAAWSFQVSSTTKRFGAARSPARPRRACCRLPCGRRRDTASAARRRPWPTLVADFDIGRDDRSGRPAPWACAAWSKAAGIKAMPSNS